jgi:hypothetical protein
MKGRLRHWAATKLPWLAAVLLGLAPWIGYGTGSLLAGSVAAGAAALMAVVSVRAGREEV